MVNSVHDTLFSPIRAADSLVPKVRAPIACMIWSHTLKGLLTNLNASGMTRVGKDQKAVLLRYRAGTEDILLREEVDVGSLLIGLQKSDKIFPWASRCQH